MDIVLFDFGGRDRFAVDSDLELTILLHPHLDLFLLGDDLDLLVFAILVDFLHEHNECWMFIS